MAACGNIQSVNQRRIDDSPGPVSASRFTCHVLATLAREPQLELLRRDTLFAAPDVPGPLANYDIFPSGDRIVMVVAGASGERLLAGVDLSTATPR